MFGCCLLETYSSLMRNKSEVDLGREEIGRKWDEWREEKLYLDYIV